ncbi:MAG: sugar phosphate nucleotidyltransferase [Candidatus Aminicenantes bacterium]|nr:sugar phosphate nucleotidyltransferase [Candidatus Aminicenantes bacterium]
MSRGPAPRAVDLRAVIMAGGTGTRFWPLSRAKRPKQFLDIVSARSMVEETVARLRPLIPARCVYPVANAVQTRTLRRILKRIPAGNFVVEPLARNTAPSLILATAAVWLKNPQAVIAALPADHLITEKERFLKKLRAAAEVAAAEDVIVTFGITPSHPATGYGYIHFDRTSGCEAGGEPFFPVLAFKEKPAREQAEAFLAEGGYAWNSGMFLWRADVFARQLERFAPDFFPFWETVVAALRQKNRRALLAAFKTVAATSIDYALMERAQGVIVSPGDFGWSDVGAWSSLLEVWPRGPEGHGARGELVSIDSRGCLVYNPKKLTALVGVEDLVVVETADALLVCRLDKDQKVRAVVDELKRRNRGCLW